MLTASKKLIIATAMATVLSVPALAQQGGSGSANGTSNATTSSPQNGNQADQQSGQAQRRPNVFAYLNLTPQQKQEWQRIQRETAQNVRAARLDESLSEEQMQQKIREIHAEQRRQLMASLNPEQQEALKQWWEEQKQQKERAAEAAGGSASASSMPSRSNDDFFAGMTQDPEPAPASPQKKQAPPKN